MNLVLDACAMIAFLRKEPGHEPMQSLLYNPELRCMAHVINLCEVYYDFLRVTDEPTAQQVLDDLATLGVIFRNDLDTQFWKTTGHYKSTLRRISLADCFALSLANRTNATIVTSDHKEFDPVAAQGICPVQFIR